jgi:hypothetical protein
LVVEGVRVLDRELLAVIGRAVPETAYLVRHRVPVAVGVADEGTSLVAPVLALVEQRGIVANDVVDRALDDLLNLACSKASVAAAVALPRLQEPALGGRGVGCRGAGVGRVAAGVGVGCGVTAGTGTTTTGWERSPAAPYGRSAALR